MPVTFVSHPDQGYLEAFYRGALTDDVLVTAWADFFRSPEWVPGLHELIDAEVLDASLITSTGLRRLAALCKRTYRQHGITLVRSGVYAPEAVHYGLARIYGAITEDSNEDMQVFTDRTAAERWVRDGVMDVS